MSRKRSIPPREDDLTLDGSSSRAEEACKEKLHRNASPVFPSLFSSHWRIWSFCLAFRAVNSMLVRTYFDPDEHWQSLEVAHRIVFGYGHLTWEWKKGIRSYAHPLIFAFLYKLLDLLRIDTLWFMTRAPRLLQSVFASVGDLYLYKLSCLLFDEHVGHWALFSQLTNWFMFFCITRTYSNCLESVLTTIALYYWLSPQSSYGKSPTMSKKLALMVAAIACILRPTSAIIWFYLGFLELFMTSNRTQLLCFEVIPIGALVFTLSSLLDRWMYGSWVIVPLNFLKFNFLSAGGDYYGTHEWHWYFTQGFPTIAFTFLPLSLHGIYKSKEWKIPCLIAWVLVIYSFLGHKEFRFVLPILPLALMFSGYSLAKTVHYLPTYKPCRFYPRKYSSRLLISSLLLITNLPVALYTSLIHQRGREDVMTFLAKEAHNGHVENILFLMPCHSTPYYSTFHHNLPMRFLDCTPSDKKDSLDESERFKNDPSNFVLEMAANWTLPSHIAMFDNQEVHLRELLHSLSFNEVTKFFNAHFPAGDVLQAFVHVYARKVP